MAAPTPMPSSFDGQFREETIFQKIWRKAYQEPLIPLGISLTCFALYQASRSMRSGDRHRTNRMFRARIYAQGFTIVAMVAGSYYYADERDKRKEFEGAVVERRHKEKQEAWIRELEHRAKEEREIEEAKRAMRKKVAEIEKEQQSTAGSVKSVLEAEERRGMGSFVLEAVRELGTSWR